MDYDIYNTPDNWIGGFYELSIEYHPFGNNKKVNEALLLCVKVISSMEFGKIKRILLSSGWTVSRIG